MIEPRFHHFGVVESTNDIALEMARNGEPEGTVVTALGQTRGRGRLGRSWWDGGDSAILSVILKPTHPPSRFPRLAFVAAVALARQLVDESCTDIMLKWPNDVLAHGKKIAGILVETDTTAGAAVVGIGVNANQREFPAQIERQSTSILIESGQISDTQALAVRVSESLLVWYDAYLRRGFEEILDHWRKYMWGLGRQACVTVAGETLAGSIVGIDAAGALLLQDERGMLREILAADSVRLADSSPNSNHNA